MGVRYITVRSISGEAWLMEYMEIYHVGYPPNMLSPLLDLGYRRILISAWDHYRRSKIPSTYVTTLKAAGGHLFVDSGMLSAIRRTKSPDLTWVDRQDAVAQLARELDADYVAHLDVPMERHGLVRAKWTHRQAIDLTLRNARAFLEMDTGRARKVFVIQGWTLDEYVYCYRSLLDIGAPNGGAWGVGSCCMRKPTRGLWQILEWARQETLGERLHVFGVGDSGKVARLIGIGIDSVDEGNSVHAIFNRQPLGHLLNAYRECDV